MPCHAATNKKPTTSYLMEACCASMVTAAMHVALCCVQVRLPPLQKSHMQCHAVQQKSPQPTSSTSNLLDGGLLRWHGHCCYVALCQLCILAQQVLLQPHRHLFRLARCNSSSTRGLNWTPGGAVRELLCRFLRDMGLLGRRAKACR